MVQLRPLPPAALTTTNKYQVTSLAYIHKWKPSFGSVTTRKKVLLEEPDLT